MIEDVFQALDRFGPKPYAYILGAVILAGWWIRKTVRAALNHTPVEDGNSGDALSPDSELGTVDRPRRRLPLE